MVTGRLVDYAFLWALAAAGLVAALARASGRRFGGLRLAWTLAAFLGLLLPGQFAHYYYIPTLAPLAAAAGARARPLA